MNLRRAIMTFALAAVSCFAADADGKWAGKITTPNGTVPISFDLKTDGNKVTGTSVGPQGEVKITDGALEGNLISFKLVFHVYDTDITLKYRGIVSPDHIDFQLIFGVDDPTPFVVKRVS